MTKNIHSNTLKENVIIELNELYEKERKNISRTENREQKSEVREHDL
ncbi:MAG: hypothetical protein KAS71_13170 [Bacteroidales bacterium]|nr:hypothetical protein [Bacteroidales bacterium]